MVCLGVSHTDIQETFVRSSGKGGQNVNKVASCVHLKHLPTGLMVKCGTKRSQSLNRFLGLRLLVDKIEEMHLGVNRDQANLDKIRRQKKRRLRRSRSKPR